MTWKLCLLYSIFGVCFPESFSLPQTKKLTFKSQWVYQKTVFGIWFFPCLSFDCSEGVMIISIKDVLAILGSPHTYGMTASMLNLAIHKAEQAGYTVILAVPVYWANVPAPVKNYGSLSS